MASDDLFVAEGQLVDVAPDNSHHSGVVSENIVAGDVVMIDPANVNRIKKAVIASEKRAFGVAIRTVNNGDPRPVTFTVRGLVRVVADAAVTLGDQVEVAATAGRVRTLTTGRALGRAFTASTGAGDIIVVLVDFAQ